VISKMIIKLKRKTTDTRHTTDVKYWRQLALNLVRKALQKLTQA